MFKATIFAITILVGGVLQAQEVTPQVKQLPTILPVINLGDVVVNVVIAKVLPVGSGFELCIAKFGGKEANASATKTTMVPVTTSQIVDVNGKKVERVVTSYSVVTAEVPKKNFTPTEQDRTVNASTVQAFDLKGNPIARDVWTKLLETPRHVLLLKEPIGESNKLNPFYAAILREDTLLLFLGREIKESELTKQ